MKRATAMARVFLLVLALLGMTVVGTGWAQPKTELTIALSSFATEVLDPPLGGHLVKYYLSMMFDYLVGTTPDGQPSRDGGIATRWENSADFKRWTFHLRKGVKFHNGDDLTSEDVKFSIMRAIGKRSTTGYAGPLRTLIQDIETPAPDRVVIVTKEPTLIIPLYLSRSLSTEGMVLPKKYIESVGDDVFARKPIGSGPYKFVEQVTGSHITLTAGDNHWRIGTPEVQDHDLPAGARGDHPHRAAAPGRGGRRRAEPRAGEGAWRRTDSRSTTAARKPSSPCGGSSGRTGGWGRRRTSGCGRRSTSRIDRAEIAQSIFGGKAEPGGRPARALLVLQGRGLQADAGHDVPLRSGAGQEAAGRRRAWAPGFNLDIYAYQLPGLPEGKTMAEAVAGLLGEARDQDPADPGGLPGLPEGVVRSQRPRRGRLLQHRQPRLDRRLRPAREAGLLGVQALRHRQRPRDRRDARRR